MRSETPIQNFLHDVAEGWLTGMDMENGVEQLTGLKLATKQQCLCRGIIWCE